MSFVYSHFYPHTLNLPRCLRLSTTVHFVVFECCFGFVFLVFFQGPPLVTRSWMSFATPGCFLFHVALEPHILLTLAPYCRWFCQSQMCLPFLPIVGRRLGQPGCSSHQVQQPSQPDLVAGKAPSLCSLHAWR